MDGDPVRPPARGHPLSAIESLRALLDVTRLIRRGEELPVVLDTIARTMGETLGLGAVVINLYRPAWDDFEVASVHGCAEARDALLGSVNSIATWAPLFDQRFERRGAFHIPAGELEWQAVMPAWVPPDTAAGEPDPAAWQPEDALFVPFADANGDVAGIFSVDEPVSGLRPSDDEIDVLVAFAEHAALAVQIAQDAAAAARHRDALGRLLEVSTSLTHASSTETLLQAVCDGIAGALEFERVAIFLTRPDGDSLAPAAWSGWAGNEPALRAPYSLTGFAALFEPRHEVEGCFLAPLEVAPALPESHRVYRSVLNGTGPRAWRRHSLIVPLYGADGETIGVIWVEDPLDRLLPGPQRLQALRLFADQATTALASAAQLAEMTFLAEHDALTRLPNRRAFVNRLERLVDDRVPFALAFVDIDGFKAVNDSFGHGAGDAALVSLAETLAGAVRHSDRAFRIGGDEFALVLSHADAAKAEAVVRRVSATLAVSMDTRLSSLRASFGIAVHPDNATSADELLRLADGAMYAAKRSGERLAFAA